MISLIASGAALLAGILHLVAHYAGWKKAIYVFKPLTVVCIIVVGLQSVHATPVLYRSLVLSGLLFSLLGDIFLMLPRDRFLHGLVTFFAAHVLYICAFVTGTLPAGFPPGWLAGVLLAYGTVLFALLYGSLGSKTVPVALYLIVLLVMTGAALSMWMHDNPAGSAFAAAGAVLFLVSDSILAVNRFTRPFRSAQALVMVTYYAAQWLIALST